MGYPTGAGAGAGTGRLLSAAEAAGEAGDSVLSLSLDNLHQLQPQASNTGTIRTVNVQYSRFWGPQHYGFFEAGLGWRGLPLYNHLMGGLGLRQALGPGLNLYGQVGVGSGGYAPDTLDTGPGFLVYPKVGAEWMLSRDLGLMLSAGYLAAPRATSRNLSYGLTLNQHFKSLAGGEGAPASAQGVRMHLLHQTQFGMTVAGRERPSLPLLTVQVDMLAGRHAYLPLQLGVATGDYAGYPGYGEVLVGAGIQTAHSSTQPWQFFGQMLVGPNVHGLMLKPQIGLNHSLNERWAWSAQLGRSIGLGHYGQKSSRQTLRANAASLGVTYRFAVARR